MQLLSSALAGAVVVACMAQADAQVLVGGNDTKVWWDDAGKVLQRAPGKDTISIIDIKDRENPKILTNLELENSIFGPPTNLAVHPSGGYRIGGQFCHADEGRRELEARSR